MILDYLKKSRGLYRVDPVDETWFSSSELVNNKGLEQLPELSRILLMSDGSMTQILETIFLSKVSIDIKMQKLISPGADVARFAGLDEGSQALLREGWLTVGDEALVYTHSLLFAAQDGDLPIAAIKKMDKPLGKMMRSDNIKTFRDRLQIGLIKSVDVAKELKAPQDSRFWARLYRLATDRGLTGVMFELFSPRLLSMNSDRSND